MEFNGLGEGEGEKGASNRGQKLLAEKERENFEIGMSENAAEG